MIELRSDTFTKPDKPMLEAMMSAEVGDDVFEGDPTVKALETKLASMLGMEAGLFCPSGTMTNQIAVRVNTQPQDDVICDQYSHVYLYEGGGMMSNSGVSVSLLEGDRGRITASQVASAIRPDDVHDFFGGICGIVYCGIWTSMVWVGMPTNHFHGNGFSQN